MFADLFGCAGRVTIQFSSSPILPNLSGTIDLTDSEWPRRTTAPAADVLRADFRVNLNHRSADVMSKFNKSVLLTLLMLAGCDTKAPDISREPAIVNALLTCSAILSEQYSSNLYNVDSNTKLHDRDRKEIRQLVSLLSDDGASSLRFLASSACLLAGGQTHEATEKFSFWEGSKDRDAIVSQNPDVLYVEALVLANIERPNEARDNVVSLTKIQGDNPWNWNLLGSIEMSLGLWEESIAAYNTSLEVDPDCREICPDRIECYCPSREKAYLGYFLASAATSGTQEACQSLAAGLKKVSGSVLMKSLYEERCANLE